MARNGIGKNENEKIEQIDSNEEENKGKENEKKEIGSETNKSSYKKEGNDIKEQDNMREEDPTSLAVQKMDKTLTVGGLKSEPDSEKLVEVKKLATIGITFTFQQKKKEIDISDPKVEQRRKKIGNEIEVILFLNYSLIEFF